MRTQTTQKPTANEIVNRVAALWQPEIENSGYSPRDIAERAFQCCREMGYRIPTSGIIKACAEHFGVAPESILKTRPHPDTLQLVRREGFKV